MHWWIFPAGYVTFHATWGLSVFVNCVEWIGRKWELEKWEFKISFSSLERDCSDFSHLCACLYNVQCTVNMSVQAAMVHAFHHKTQRRGEAGEYYFPYLWRHCLQITVHGTALAATSGPLYVMMQGKALFHNSHFKMLLQAILEKFQEKWE